MTLKIQISMSWPRSNPLSHLRPRVQIDMFAFCFVAIRPFWLRYRQFHIWPWKFKVKVMAKVKSDGHIWGLAFNWYVCFSFRGNPTISGRDIANSAFDLENSRSRSWPRSNPMVTFEVWRSIDMFTFVSWPSHHFWLRYSQFDIWLENSRPRSWPRSNPMITFEA